MSHDHYHAGEAEPPPDILDIPISAGVAPSVRVLLIASVIASIAMGAIVVIAANFGRIWPAVDSTKVLLPGS
jgi:hypothetical protein